MTTYFIGVDVGTGSARAGVFDRMGEMIATARRDIRMWRDGPDIAEQSSSDIWRSVCEAVRQAVSEAGVGAEQIAGLGFDATCSLVVLGPEGRPLAVGPHNDAQRDIIVWMDHRAIDQAKRINSGGHAVLEYVGGKISPEMQTPKLLWLKEHMPQTYAQAWRFFDLCDFLTWRATASLVRSSCTVTCKWTYLGHERRWDRSYFHSIGLGDLADDNFVRIGEDIAAPGSRVGVLTEEAATELGLRPGVPVGAGMIDAHAGGVGSVGVRAPHGTLLTRIAYVFGTSACTMASSREPIFIPGVWGPYFNAMAPGLWLNEGGQSSAGAAIEQLVAFHPARDEAQAGAAEANTSLIAWLADRAAEKVGSASEAVRLARRIVVAPDFLGNRSPHADPEARAAVAGLGMERDLDHLIALYVAGMLGVGYGLRQIIDASRAAGATIDAIVLSGGAGAHPITRQLLADCSGLPVLAPRDVDPVMLGAAMLGASASGVSSGLSEAMTNMAPDADVYEPATGAIAQEHAGRYAAFQIVQKVAKSARDAIVDAGAPS